MNATIALISQPLLPSVGQEEQFQSPSPKLGEGFRVRAKIYDISKTNFSQLNSH
jgi:hypothetical protein